MPKISFSHISPNGNYVSMFPSLEKTIREIAKISVKDSHTWAKIFQEYLQEKESIIGSINNPSTGSKYGEYGILRN